MITGNDIDGWAYKNKKTLYFMYILFLKCYNYSAGEKSFLEEQVL